MGLKCSYFTTKNSNIITVDLFVLLRSTCSYLFLCLHNVPVLILVHIRDRLAMTSLRAAVLIAATLSISHPVTLSLHSFCYIRSDLNSQGKLLVTLCSLCLWENVWIHAICKACNYRRVCGAMLYYRLLSSLILFHLVPFCTVTLSRILTLAHHVLFCTVLSHSVLSYPILNRVITHCPTLSHFVPSYHAMSHFVPSCPILFHLVPSCLILSRFIPFCPVLSRRAPFCPILSHFVPSCPTLSCLVPF